jgi:hypothetical protein
MTVVSTTVQPTEGASVPPSTGTCRRTATTSSEDERLEFTVYDIIPGRAVVLVLVWYHTRGNTVLVVFYGKLQ